MSDRLLTQIPFYEPDVLFSKIEESEYKYFNNSTKNSYAARNFKKPQGESNLHLMRNSQR